MKLGTVEVNKFADLLVIDGDPIADIKNVRNVVSVYKGGEKV